MKDCRKRTTDEPFGLAIAILFGAGIVGFVVLIARAAWTSLMQVWTP